MKCPVCQTRLRASAIFCDTCGSKLDKSAEATLLLSNSKAQPPTTLQPNTAPVSLLLGGAAILLVGLWLGATFFSAAPTLSPRETTTLLLSEQPHHAPRPEEPPASAPATPAPALQEAPAPIPQPTDMKPRDGHLVDPFKKKRPETTPEPDSVLNPFHSGDASLKNNADATLKPRFNTELNNPFAN